MEIGLIDLMKFILKKWRLLVLVMLILSLLMGGYKVVSNIKYNHTVSSQDVTTDEDLWNRYINNTSLSASQIDELKSAIALDEKMVEFNNTELMKYSDSNKSMISSAIIQYSIEIEADGKDSYEVGNMVMYALTQYALKGGMATQIFNDGYNAQNVEEISSMIQFEYSLPQRNESENRNMTLIPFYISCNASEDDTALALVERVKPLVQEYIGKFKKYGSFTLTITDEYIAEVKDESFQQKYSSKVSEYNTMNDQLTRKTASFVDEQKAIFNLITGKNRFALTDPNVTTRIASSGENKTIPVLSGVIKRGVLGALVGLFLVCGLYSCVYVFNGTIKTKDEIENIYDLFVIGEMNDGKAILGTKIKSACEKNNKNKVGILTSTKDKVLQQNIQDLADELRKDGIDCEVVEGNIDQKENFEKILSLGELIAIEEQYVSKRSELDNLLGLCDRYGINLQGVIMK